MKNSKYNEYINFIDGEVWIKSELGVGLLASNFGRVMIEPYQGTVPNGGFRTYGGTPTYGQWDGKRYIYARRGYKTLKIARIICQAFNGDPTIEKSVCMHLDEDSRNNNASNLKWGTQKENLNFPKFIKYCKSRTGEKNPFIISRKKKNTSVAKNIP